MARKKITEIDAPEEIEEEIYHYEPEPLPEPKTPFDMVEIVPLRDFAPGIHHNDIHVDNIKMGEPVTIPRKFLRNMVTEKVIDKIPQ